MLQQIKDAHEIANDYFFEGLLNMPKFRFYTNCIMDNNGYIWEGIENLLFLEFDGAGEVWGYYQAEKNLIGLTVNDNIYITLLHEMIHQYQQELNLIDKDHGRTFRKYARIIENTLNLEKGTI